MIGVKRFFLLFLCLVEGDIYLWEAKLTKRYTLTCKSDVGLVNVFWEESLGFLRVNIN